MLRPMAVFLLSAGVSALVRADVPWVPVTVAGLKADPVRVLGPDCKGSTEETLTKNDVTNIAAATIKPSGGCVKIMMKDGAGPKYVAERMLDIPDKPAGKKIKCPPGITMSERDKTSNTSMGYDSDCVPEGAPQSH